jgi:hypothetical protein
MIWGGEKTSGGKPAESPTENPVENPQEESKEPLSFEPPRVSKVEKKKLTDVECEQLIKEHPLDQAKLELKLMTTDVMMPVLISSRITEIIYRILHSLGIYLEQLSDQDSESLPRLPRSTKHEEAVGGNPACSFTED